MARFVFKLDGVLRHRLRQEQEAQRLLAEKQKVVVDFQAELAELQRGLAGATDDLRRNHLTGPINVAYLTAHRRFAADVTQRGLLLVQRLALAQRACEEARGGLAAAARARKVLETLRDQQRARWSAEQGRVELAAADDDASRHAFRQMRLAAAGGES